jgi:DNA gyrase/topoisomerase IV subunit A
LSSRQDYKEHHDNVNVHFVINLAAKDVEKAEEQGLTEFFKLTSKINTSNMICFDFEGKIKKYSSPEEIIDEFYPKRLAYYQKRKARTRPLLFQRRIYRSGSYDVVFSICRTSSRTSYSCSSRSCRTRRAS